MDLDSGFSSVVDAAWLQNNLSKVKVLDASWHLPASGRDAKAEFQASRIPGARFFDLDAVADASSELPHMLPSAAAFAAAAQALGISPQDTLVAYDSHGLFSAPRAWWMWKAFGHGRVAVLDGGLPAWRAAGGALDASPASREHIDEPGRAAASAGAQRQSPKRTTYPSAALDAMLVRSADEMLANTASRREQVMDARSPGRFAGDLAEPRAGLARGHIPGSVNVPWDAVQREGRLVPKEELRAIFRKQGLDLDRPIVATCGSGVTACVIALAAQRAGHAGRPVVYDGSWSEWGALSHVPVEKGE